ncbi:MAG: GNAT family N-acetyltransferase [Actinomycetota bacterium]|nr:GNAT family N-acetyltransferase [Actinomycetota bacterium]
MPAPGRYVTLEVEARDGTPILIRPILPEDADRLRSGFQELSEESRYRRFMAPMSEIGDEQVRYLTQIDYYDHMAWVALDPTRPDQPGLGVARYVRIADEPTVAEAAVTVLDSHHGRGIGTILLAMLALSARENGITTFRGFVLEENAAVLETLRQMGGIVEQFEGSVMKVDVPIPEDPDDLPDTPAGRTFRAVAKRLIPPGSILYRHLR